MPTAVLWQYVLFCVLYVPEDVTALDPGVAPHSHVRVFAPFREVKVLREDVPAFIVYPVKVWVFESVEEAHLDEGASESATVYLHTSLTFVS